MKKSFFIVFLILFFSIAFADAQFTVPDNITVNESFIVNISLSNFSDGLYDVKVYNLTEGVLVKIWNGTTWVKGCNHGGCLYIHDNLTISNNSGKCEIEVKIEN